MKTELNSYKRDLGVSWIRANSGRTYLCPTGEMENIDLSNESQIRSQCVEESINPQND